MTPELCGPLTESLIYFRNISFTCLVIWITSVCTVWLYSHFI